MESKSPTIGETRANIEKEITDIQKELDNLNREWANNSLFKKVLFTWLIYFPIRSFWYLTIKLFERDLKKITDLHIDLKHGQIKLRWVAALLANRSDASTNPKLQKLTASLDSLDNKLQSVLKPNEDSHKSVSANDSDRNSSP